MCEEKLYTIGKVSELCKLPKKTLRFYDENDIIKPDVVSDETGYRYYSEKTMYKVPPLKYFKAIGFSLEQVKMFLEKPPYSVYEASFSEKMEELNSLQEKLNLKIRLIKDWNDLITEARLVIDNEINTVSFKVVDQKKMLCMDQPYTDNYQKKIINLDYTNYVSETGNFVLGAVIISYPSYKEKMQGSCKTMMIMQECVHEIEPERISLYGGGTFCSCYHIGNYDNINETYEKMIRWAEKHGYQLEEKVYERHVTDYWLTQNTDLFVTEILMKANKRK